MFTEETPGGEAISLGGEKPRRPPCRALHPLPCTSAPPRPEKAPQFGLLPETFLFFARVQAGGAPQPLVGGEPIAIASFCLGKRFGAARGAFGDRWGHKPGGFPPDSDQVERPDEHGQLAAETLKPCRATG